MISQLMKTRFDHEVAKFPADQKQSAVMACLAIVQQELGWVSSESEKGVAEHLSMAPMAVHEITTFYNMFNQKPVGKFKLNVCTNLPCQLRGGAQALTYLEHKLGIHAGETTADGVFSVRTVECLASCGTAPMMQVADKYYENLDEATVDRLIGELREAAKAGYLRV